jgi:glycosyltransferase EpsF
MDVFVLPSLYEGLPVVGVEAQMSDLYCVFSDTITKEVKLLDSSLFMSISSDSAEKWAEKIFSLPLRERETAVEQIVGAGFEIRIEATKLSVFLRGLRTSEVI